MGSRLRGCLLGSRSLWVPRLPDLILVKGEPRERMGIVQWQENHPSRWTCAQEELSVPEASKEGPAGGVWGFGERVAACGLDHLTALGLHPSSLCPISGLLSASPQCQDLRQLQVETLAGEGTPPWDLNPSEMEQLQNCVPLFPLLQKFPSLPRTPLEGGAEMSPGTRLRCPYRSWTLG